MLVHGAAWRDRLASNSLTECFVFGRRAALAASAEPAPGRGATRAGVRDQNRDERPPQITPGTREALWQLAGLERDRAGLELLAEDPYPLARLIAPLGRSRGPRAAARTSAATSPSAIRDSTDST